MKKFLLCCIVFFSLFSAEAQCDPSQQCEYTFVLFNNAGNNGYNNNTINVTQNGNEANMDVSVLSKGIYLVKITTSSNQKITRKLIID
jgi:hypothetical protein